MLSCRLADRLPHSKRGSPSHPCRKNLVSTHRSPQFAVQSRGFLDSAKTTLKRWFGPSRSTIPLTPSSSTVLFSENNVWVRAGPTEQSVLIGLTEEVKELLRPHAEMETWEVPNTFMHNHQVLASMVFDHPDDVDKGRPQREKVVWEVRMPLPGNFKAFNPLINTIGLLQRDPHFNNWLFSIDMVLEKDWNKLMTGEEYQQYVQKTANLLAIDWQPSQYADAWEEVKKPLDVSVKPVSTRQRVEDIIAARKKQDSGL